VWPQRQGGPSGWRDAEDRELSISPKAQDDMGGRGVGSGQDIEGHEGKGDWAIGGQARPYADVSRFGCIDEPQPPVLSCRTAVE
jgi:hypothetical protein